ncbi:hypothetical protein [Streptomyces sp. NPDC088246]
MKDEFRLLAIHWENDHVKAEQAHLGRSRTQLGFFTMVMQCG